MFKRHIVLRDFVCDLNDVDHDAVLLSACFERSTYVLLTILEEVNDVALKLQLYSCAICQTRAYYDSVLRVSYCGDAVEPIPVKRA